MNIKDQIEMKYSADEYIEKFAELDLDPNESETKYQAWMSKEYNNLKGTYIERVVDNDEVACSIGWQPWSRFMFTVALFNTMRDNQFQDEMNELMGS